MDMAQQTQSPSGPSPGSPGNCPSPTAAAEPDSPLAIIRILRRHWRCLLISSLLPAGAAGIFLATRREIFEAEMVLDDSIYEIKFDDSARLPPDQHLSLSRSAQLRDSLVKRLDGEPSLANRRLNVDSIFSVSRRGRGLKGIRISAQGESMEDALRALSIWAEEYRKLAARYRNRKVMELQQSSIQAQTAELLRNQILVQRMARTSDDISAVHSDSAVRAIAFTNALVDAWSDLISARCVFAFAQEVFDAMQKMDAKWSGDFSIAETNALENPEGYARCLVLQGQDALFSQARPVLRPKSIAGRSAFVFLLALTIASFVVLSRNARRH